MTEQLVTSPMQHSIGFVCGRKLFDFVGWIEPKEAFIFYLFHESEFSRLNDAAEFMESCPKSKYISVQFLPDGFSFEEKIREICRQNQSIPDARHVKAFDLPNKFKE